MIAINYNDIIIEEYLNNKKNEIEKLIHTKNDHSNKLLSKVLKNCDLLTKHYKILIKPNFDKKTEEEQKREKNVQKHGKAMQEKISSRTRGVKIKLLEKGGLFSIKL